MGIKEDLDKIIEYLWNDEEKDYESYGETEEERQKEADSHIFLHLKRVKEWLDSPCCPLVDEDELKDETEGESEE